MRGIILAHALEFLYKGRYQTINFSAEYAIHSCGDTVRPTFLKTMKAVLMKLVRLVCCVSLRNFAPLRARGCQAWEGCGSRDRETKTGVLQHNFFYKG